MSKNEQTEEKLKEPLSILRTIIEATTGPLITHQRAVFSLVSQHLEEEEGQSANQ